MTHVTTRRRTMKNRVHGFEPNTQPTMKDAWRVCLFVSVCFVLSTHIGDDRKSVVSPVESTR